MATPSGFEPPISTLTGWHVRPLHHGANRQKRIPVSDDGQDDRVGLIDVTFGNEDHPACVVSATARASNEVPATANQGYSIRVAWECREDVGIHRTRLQFRQRYDFNRTDRVSVLLAVRHRHVQGIVVGRAGQVSERPVPMTDVIDVAREDAVVGGESRLAESRVPGDSLGPRWVLKGLLPSDVDGVPYFHRRRRRDLRAAEIERCDRTAVWNRTRSWRGSRRCERLAAVDLWRGHAIFRLEAGRRRFGRNEDGGGDCGEAGDCGKKGERGSFHSGITTSQMRTLMSNERKERRPVAPVRAAGCCGAPPRTVRNAPAGSRRPCGQRSLSKPRWKRLRE